MFTELVFANVEVVVTDGSSSIASRLFFSAFIDQIVCFNHTFSLDGWQEALGTYTSHAETLAAGGAFVASAGRRWHKHAQRARDFCLATLKAHFRLSGADLHQNLTPLEFQMVTSPVVKVVIRTHTHAHTYTHIHTEVMRHGAFMYLVVFY